MRLISENCWNRWNFLKKVLSELEIIHDEILSAQARKWPIDICIVLDIKLFSIQHFKMSLNIHIVLLHLNIARAR